MNIIFLGPPGAGKGTVAAELKKHIKLNHLSTGDMLRSEIKAGTELGVLAKQYIDEGKLVPDEVIIGMVVQSIADADGDVLFDGFPRTVGQARELDKVAKIDLVINLIADEEVVVKRICSRRICRNCGKVFNTSFYDSDTCDDCGGKLYIRDDDSEETARKRFNVYNQQTAPLVEYYDEKGILKSYDANHSTGSIVDSVLEILESAK